MEIRGLINEDNTEVALHFPERFPATPSPSRQTVTCDCVRPKLPGSAPSYQLVQLSWQGATPEINPLSGYARATNRHWARSARRTGS